MRSAVVFSMAVSPQVNLIDNGLVGKFFLEIFLLWALGRTPCRNQHGRWSFFLFSGRRLLELSFASGVAQECFAPGAIKHCFFFFFPRCKHGLEFRCIWQVSRVLGDGKYLGEGVDFTDQEISVVQGVGTQQDPVTCVSRPS